MNSPRQAKRSWKYLVWLLAGGFAAGLFCLYRWAEQGGEHVSPPTTSGAPVVTIRLTDAPLEGESNGRIAWSVFAHQIDLTRTPGASLSTIQSATLLAIQRGKLYQIPEDLVGAVGSTQPTAHATGRDTGIPVSTFSADRGVYTYGASAYLPDDLRTTFTPEWEFQLSGHVVVNTKPGDDLRAPSIAIMELYNRQTRKRERRILCDTGATVSHAAVVVAANRAVYDPGARTAEAEGGVRGTTKDGAVLSDRLTWSLNAQEIRCPVQATGTFKGFSVTASQVIWSLKDHIIRCGGTVTGLLHGSEFSATGLVIDLKKKHMSASHASVAVTTGELAQTVTH